MHGRVVYWTNAAESWQVGPAAGRLPYQRVSVCPTSNPQLFATPPAVVLAVLMADPQSHLTGAAPASSASASSPAASAFAADPAIGEPRSRPSLHPPLTKVAALSPTGGYFFGFPDFAKEDVEAAWSVYCKSFRPAKDRVGGLDCGGDVNLQKAYAFMDDAVWTEEDRQRRLLLAHEALQVSPDCAEAYLVVGELESRDLATAFDWFTKGVRAAERHLERVEANFLVKHAENPDVWWQVPATQPYLRLRVALANTIRCMREYASALVHYRELMTLCQPRDYLGLKTGIVLCFLGLHMWEQAAAFISVLYSCNAPGIVPAYLFWTDVLLTFRATMGQTKEAADVCTACLNQAIQMVPVVLLYLVGETKLPSFPPAWMETGTVTEAVAYVLDSITAWQSVPGALDWLKQCRREGAGSDRRWGRSLEKALALKSKGNSAFRDGAPERLQAAMQLYISAMKFLPEEEDRERAILMSNQGAVLLELGNAQQCLRMCNTALQFDPSYAKAHLRAAQALVKLGMTEDAKRAVDAALAMEPGNPLAQDLLVEIASMASGVAPGAAAGDATADGL